MAGTVFDTFAASAARFADHPFLHVPASACRGWHDGAVEIGYAAMLARVAALRDRYAAAGYGTGHRVALLLDNRPEFFAHWLALNALGASVVPLNAEQPPAELAWPLGHSEACLVVSLAERSTLAASAAALLDDPRPLLHTAGGDAIPPAPRPRAHTSPGAGSECALLYTSGSTGKPKGCILANDYFTRFGAWYAGIGGLCALRPGRERLITPLPLTHMNAMAVSTMGMIATGGCVVQLDRFHPASWWDDVRESGATVVHYLGVMPAILLGLPASPADDLRARVRFGFGAGVNPRHHAAFEQRFGFPLIEAWAMTESGCGGCIIANREPRHVGSCCFGKPAPEVEYRLVDEAGADVAPGVPGELLVRGAGPDPRAGFFAGYLKNPEATAEAWAGGWLHTGDVVRAGPDGSLHFVDRRKNVIRRSGENIAALEVEAALADDPRIAQLVVTAVEDEIRGEEVMACVIPRAGVPATLQSARAIQQTALDALAYFKAPGYVVFVDAIPRTASQKPQRGEIRQLAARWRASAHCFDLRAAKRRPVPQA
jgi:acyl-CoA synthetase (AMP-forming)/AMP-acid ligase II